VRRRLLLATSKVISTRQLQGSLLTVNAKRLRRRPVTAGARCDVEVKVVVVRDAALGHLRRGRCEGYVTRANVCAIVALQYLGEGLRQSVSHFASIRIGRVTNVGDRAWECDRSRYKRGAWAHFRLRFEYDGLSSRL